MNLEIEFVGYANVYINGVLLLCTSRNCVRNGLEDKYQLDSSDASNAERYAEDVIYFIYLILIFRILIFF